MQMTSGIFLVYHERALIIITISYHAIENDVGNTVNTTYASAAGKVWCNDVFPVFWLAAFSIAWYKDKSKAKKYKVLTDVYDNEHNSENNRVENIRGSFDYHKLSALI